ncbi:MAG: hypothetical protein DBX55_07370 [Verrucomicrobia bacterium]|nr:MAG: hypothetical protein DBX55_07370 [Verrucomicrobiota bacterium]
MKKRGGRRRARGTFFCSGFFGNAAYCHLKDEIGNGKLWEFKDFEADLSPDLSLEIFYAGVPK